MDAMNCHNKLVFLLSILFVFSLIISCSKFCYCKVIVEDITLKKGTDIRSFRKFDYRLNEINIDTVSKLINQGFQRVNGYYNIYDILDANDEVQNRAKALGGSCVCN
jgi:hypothetical protein